MSGAWMSLVVQAVLQWFRDVVDAWDRFWFTPAAPQTLALIRVLSGALLFYTHLVWATDLRAFLGPDSWLTAEAARQYSDFYWTPLWHTESMPLLWIFHLGGMIVIGMAAIGLWTRVTTVLSWMIAVFYCHRLHGSLFGLDQINVMLAMYVMLGPSGACYSVDRWRARRAHLADPAPAPAASVAANLSIRLIQVHMCLIYLFGGIGKMQGAQWWDGSAVWFAVANPEYQSIDMTWLGQWPFLIALLTHVTTFWEAYYCALIWPRLTRPIALGLAVAVHGGIALFLGMITFGSAMIIANLAFLSPRLVAALLSRLPWSRDAARA